VQALKPRRGKAGKDVSVSASIGVAIYPDDGTEIDTLIKAADEAMYRMKNTGKNGYVFVSPHGSGEAAS
jgi:diguanylate cyclase (GGDEF)-like protein